MRTRSTIFRRSAIAATAAVASLALTLSMAPFHAAYAAGLTAVPDGIAYDVAPRVPVIESAIGRGSVSTPNETTVALPGVEGDKAALVRISVFDAAADLDVTVAGAPALHVANGQDASTTVLAPVRNGAISLGASTAVNARVEVLATFDPDVTAPGATIALDAPVTRADTSKALGLSALGAAAESFGVVGLGGVPSDDVRAVYATLTIDATDTGTIKFGGQDLAIPAGRSVISTIVMPDADGNVAIASDDALAGTTNIRVDVRGYVSGSPQNTELANVAGSYVPATGTDWSSAKASSSKTGSLSLPDTDDSAFGIALVSAIRTGDSDARTFVDVGKTIGGRSTGMLVDEAGALPQLEIVEDVDGRTPVAVRGASVNVDAMLLGDIVGDRPEVNDTVNITIDSPEQDATLDFAETGGITIAGTVDANSAVEAVEIYGDDEKIGTAAIDYTTDGATWTFTGAAPHDGVVTYEAKAITRGGTDASSSLNVNVTLPDEDETVIDPDTVVLPVGEDSPVAAIDAQTVTFNSKPEFHVGQIIVSDVCEGAPEGFLRWVDAIELNGAQWIVTTHQAALTEAIMQGKTQAGTDTAPDRVSLSEPDTAPEGNITVLDGPEKSLTLLGADGATVSGVSAESSAYAAQPAVARSSDTKARAVAAKAKSDWVDQDDRDVMISTSASVSKKYALFGGGDSTSVGTEDKVEVGDGLVSRAVDISQTSESNKKKITDQLSVSGGVSFNVKATAELYVLFGLEIDMHWDWNPLNDVSYLKAEGGSSLEGEIGVEGTASLTWSDSVKIGKLEQGKTFMVGIVPVYVSAQADITLEPSIKVAGKISWTKNVKVEAQAGARHQGDDNIKLKGYANVRGNESKDTTCPNAGFSGELSLTPEIGIAVAPKLKLYDAIGPGIKLTPAIGGKISGKVDDSGTLTGSSELYAQVSAQVTFDLTIPVIDTELAHWESDKLTAKYTISADKDMTIPACKPDDGSTDGGSGEGSGGGTAWDTVGNVAVTWKDPTSGKTASYTVKSGTQFFVDQAQLESKLGLGAGALDGMRGVATGENGTGKVYRTGTVFQATSDTTLYVFYNDPELPEIDNTDTDIVFVIDSTGSMGDEIGAVKAYVNNLADAIGGVSASYRMALVDYKDDCDSYQSRVDVDFTSDVPTFKEGVSNLYADGGGDEAESVYSGLNTALDLDWRDGVRRSIFIIGDAPGKDPEPVTGFTQSDIVDKAIAKGVGIYPLGRVSSYGRARSMPSMPESNGNDQNNDQQNDAAPDIASSKDESGAVSEPAAALLSDTLLSPAEATSGNAVVRTIADTRAVDTSSFEGFTSGLADATGGVYTEYTSEDFVEKLLQIVVSATVTPQVTVGTTNEFHTGDTVHFNASVVTDESNPVIGYDWNFGVGTPSGEFDQTTESGDVDMVFNEPGTYTVTVTVRTQSGISGRGSHTIVVTDRVPTTTFSSTVTLASGRTPTFTLPVLPGTEAYGTLTFDNGEQTKTVPGEGTWSISMDGNLITAVFTPEEGYTGSAPTPQTYLLSDAFGDTVNGRLTVVYK